MSTTRDQERPIRNRPTPGGRHRPRAHFTVLSAFALLACLPDSTPIAPPAGTDLAVLFVGNSLTYTNDLPGMVSHLLTTYGDVGTVFVDAVAFPNFGLQDHWLQGTARERIAAGGWDFVVVQQGPSATEGRPSLIEYAALFADEASAVGGRGAVYMVWPSLARAFDFDGVSDAHQVAAEQADALLFPAGEAWRAAWARDPGLDLYGPDGFHPSPIGTYLAALVVFERLSGVDPGSLPPGILTAQGAVQLPAGTSEILAEAAAEANRNFGVASPR